MFAIDPAILAQAALLGGGPQGMPTGLSPSSGMGYDMVNQQIAQGLQPPQQQQPGMPPMQMLQSLMGNMRQQPQQPPAMPMANFGSGQGTGNIAGMPMGAIAQAMQALYGGRGGVG